MNERTRAAACKEEPPIMRIKVINPNTTQSMTAKIAEAARAVAAPGTEIIAVSPAAGPVSIEGHYDEVVASVGVIEEVRAGERDGIDAFVVACFGDPGLHAAREVATGPVVGIAEAAMHMASFVSPGFSVVTTLPRSANRLRHLAEAYGMTRFLLNIRASKLAVLDLEEEGSQARHIVLAECRRAVEEDGAGAVLLGCAGMADLARDIERQIGVPVIDGVAAAVKQAEALVGLGLQTTKNGEFAYPLPKPYRGRFADLAP
jgi:allantoin racemase